MLFFYIAGWIAFAHACLMPYLTCCKRRSRLNLARIRQGKQLWPIVSAHRGGSFERTENTLYAFKNAISLGVNLLECDVHLSKDGVVVVAHDADLQRLCKVDRNIAELNFSELPPMQRSIPLHFSEN